MISQAWDFATSEKGRFLLVGAWNTLAGYLIFIAVHFAAGSALKPIWTLVISYCVALPHSFITQRLLVFRGTGAWQGQFRRFAVTNSIVFASNLAFLPLTIAATGLNPLAAQAGFVLASTIASYVIHKHYSFAE